MFRAFKNWWNTPITNGMIVKSSIKGTICECVVLYILYRYYERRLQQSIKEDLHEEEEHI